MIIRLFAITGLIGPRVSRNAYSSSSRAMAALSPNLPGNVDPKDIPKNQLRDQFEAKMKNAKIPLFKDFDVYCNSLPTKYVDGEDLALHECPYWTNDKALEATLKATTRHHVDRRFLHFMMAPHNSGKTAGVLPAFLKSAVSDDDDESKFTHYVYIPFGNERGLNFVPSNLPAKSFNDGYDHYTKLGAEFMYGCLQEAWKGPTC